MVSLIGAFLKQTQPITTLSDLQKDLIKNVYSSFNHNSLKPERAKVSINGMNKQTVAYSDGGALLSKKKHWTAGPYNYVGESQMLCAERKRADSKGYVLYNST